MKALAKRVWDSPTIMTWMSYSTKALSLFIVLPLILKNFGVAEVGLWYLFSSIVVLSGLADFGFRNTFSRIISFAYGGAQDVGIHTGTEQKEKNGINWPLIESICSNMKLIYAVLALMALLVFASLGSWSLIKPISLVENQQEAWLAWGIIVASSIIQFYGTIYQNYLTGLFKVALVRRVETFMSLGSIITNITVLSVGGTLLHLIIASQIWIVLNVIRNLFLAKTVEDGKHRHFVRKPFDSALFKKIWSPAWRSGLSGLMATGPIQLSGVLYAQIGTPETIAAYLLALRVITQIKEVSMAPFYSKIPLLARFRVRGELKLLIKEAQRGMFIGHMVFVFGVMAVASLSGYLLSLIGSETSFVSVNFWLLLSLAFFVHRYGALHMQLYLTTNHVISHIADGVAGVLFIGSSFLLVKWLDIAAIPVGMLIGYLGFYSWYSAYHSIKSLDVRFLEFELRSALFPFLVFTIFALAIMFGQYFFRNPT